MCAVNLQSQAVVKSTPHQRGARKGRGNVSGRSTSVSWGKIEKVVGQEYVCRLTDASKLVVVGEYL